MRSACRGTLAISTPELMQHGKSQSNAGVDNGIVQQTTGLNLMRQPRRRTEARHHRCKCALHRGLPLSAWAHEALSAVSEIMASHGLREGAGEVERMDKIVKQTSVSPEQSAKETGLAASCAANEADLTEHRWLRGCTYDDLPRLFRHSGLRVQRIRSGLPYVSDNR